MQGLFCEYSSVEIKDRIKYLCFKMKKAELISQKQKEEDRILEDIRRTPEERIALAFKLTRLALLHAPPEGFTDDSDKDWVVLKRKKRVF